MHASGSPGSRGFKHAAAPGDNHAARRRVRALLLASITGRHVTQGWAKAVQSGWRLLPRRLRRRLVRVLRPVLPVSAAIGLHTAGHRGAARTELQRLYRTQRSRWTAIDAATACGELDVARRAVELHRHIPATTGARLLRAEGHLQRALEAASLATSPGARWLVDELAGELRALNPQGRTDLRRTRVMTHVPPATPRHAHPHRGPALRVLHVVSNSLPDTQAGYTLRTAGIVSGQQRIGLEPHVVTRLGFPIDTGAVAAAERVEIDGVPHHRLLPRLLPRRKDAALEEAERQLARLVDELRPDVIHAHSKHENAQIAIAVAARRSIPVVYEVRGMLEETWRSRGGEPTTDFYRLNREAETWCMRHVRRVLTLGTVMAEEIVERGIPADHVVITPNAVDTRFLDTLPRAEARERLALTDEQLVVGVAGTLNDYEGVDILIRAFAQADLPDAELLVVGDGPAATELRQLAKASGAHVRFTGRIAHELVPVHLAAMDLFCVPRLPTPVTELVSPLKPVEAMAVGIPLLVSDLAPLTELLAGGAHGWEAPAGDVDVWAATLRTLGTRAGALSGARRAAARWIAATRTWDVLALQHAAVYSDVVAEASGVAHQDD